VWLKHVLLAQITAPFLQIGGVVVATLASWFVAGQFMRHLASHKTPSMSPYVKLIIV